MKTRFILLSIIILLCSCEKGEVIAPDNISGNLYKIYSKRYQKIDGDWERIPNEGSLPYNASIHWLIKEDGVCRYVYFPLTAEDNGDIALYDTEYDSYYFQPDYKKRIVKTNIFGSERSKYELYSCNSEEFQLRYYPEKKIMTEITMSLIEWSDAFENALPDTPENRVLVDQELTGK